MCVSVCLLVHHCPSSREQSVKENTAMCCCPANTLDIKVILCKLNFRTNLERNSIGAFAMDVMVSQSWLLIFLLSFSSAQFCHATLCIHILLFGYIHYSQHNTSTETKWWLHIKMNSKNEIVTTTTTTTNRSVQFLNLFASHCIRNIKITLISMITSLSQYAIRNCRRLFLRLNTFQNANRHSNRK